LKQDLSIIRNIRALKATNALAPFRLMKENRYYIEFVKQALEEHVENPQEIYTTGFNIKTPISLQMTNYAYEAIEGCSGVYEEASQAIPPRLLS
jgi:membrane carboxypeptidase/penicillin-binding protein